MIGETHARLRELCRQVQEDRVRYEHQVRFIELEIQRVWRVARSAEGNSYEEQNGARGVSEETDRAQAQTGAASRHHPRTPTVLASRNKHDRIGKPTTAQRRTRKTNTHVSIEWKIWV